MSGSVSMIDGHIDEVLKPCPFCGSEKVEVLNRLEWEPEMEVVGLTKDNWNVLCNECYAIGGTRRTAFEAIDAWNMRAGT